MKPSRIKLLVEDGAWGTWRVVQYVDHGEWHLEKQNRHVINKSGKVNKKPSPWVLHGKEHGTGQELVLRALEECGYEPTRTV